MEKEVGLVVLFALAFAILMSTVFYNMTLVFIGGALVKASKRWKEWKYYHAIYQNQRRNFARSLGFFIRAVGIIVAGATPLVIFGGCAVYVVYMFKSSRINGMFSIPVSMMAFCAMGYITLMFQNKND